MPILTPGVDYVWGLDQDPIILGEGDININVELELAE